MTTPFPFVSGAVLTAAQLNDITNLPINDQTASYTLVVGDAGKRVVMNVASSNTVTVNNSIFTTGDTIFIANKGAGTSTITAGAGVTINTAGSLALSQYGGGTLVALSASTFTFFSGAIPQTLSVEYLLVGGGGGGGANDNAISGLTGCGGGGGAGGMFTATDLIAKGNAYTVTIGAGGVGGSTTAYRPTGQNGTASSFIRAANGGGGGIGRGGSNIGQNGASGGGGISIATLATGISGEGNDGGTTAGGVISGAGGGGGKGGAGSNGAANTGGAGGAASTNSFTGTSISYSGGGGGGGNTTGGTAGTNAGNGGGNAAGSNATANRGGGGGGGSESNKAGGNGGSGQVVLRILTADLSKFTVTTTGSPTTGTDGSYTYYQYTATGTFRID